MERPGVRAAGLAVALASAAMFATSGSFARPLMEAGWSPAAAVLVRLGLASFVLWPLAAKSLAGQWGMLRTKWRPILAYGLLGGAAVQVAYFNAITSIEVGIALMLEYLGVVLVVLWVWARTRRRPGPMTLTGMVVAVAGLAVILNPADLAGADLRGVAWGLFAATGMATYFIVSAETADIPPIAFVASGLGVGTLALLVSGLVGLVPLRATTNDVVMFGTPLPWWVPLLELAIVAAALAYVTGFVAARQLGPTVASFVGLTEVVFAVAWAWLLLGELPGAVQLLGGAVLITGVAAVQAGNLRDTTRLRRAPEPAGAEVP